MIKHMIPVNGNWSAEFYDARFEKDFYLPIVAWALLEDGSLHGYVVHISTGRMILAPNLSDEFFMVDGKEQQPIDFTGYIGG